MSVPVISVAQMREWEAATWAAGQTEAEVIRRVGQRVAWQARQMTVEGDTILILAGKGHNGDDARTAKDFLEDRKVQVLDLLQPENDLLPLQRALQEKPVLVVDGIFGIGLNRELAEPWRKIVETVNASKRPVLAVDVPSGLNADTGEHFGAVIEAAVTLTVGAPKRGMLAPAAWARVGRLEVAEEVGLVPCPLSGALRWLESGDFENFPPRRGVAEHKGSHGHTMIVAGSLGYHGAAVLAARGAQRAQPGLVTVFTREEVYTPVASQLQAAMVRCWKHGLELGIGGDVTLIGPGLAAAEIQEETQRAMKFFWSAAECPVVVDASALQYLPEGKAMEDFPRVITPHPGEAARLLNLTPKAVQADRVGSLRTLSEKYGGCWVVLKGHQTLIGRAEGEIYVNPTGNPHLAQGGSGDLLAGFITGLLAQPALQADVGRTLAYAVYEHGAAADRLQSRRSNWTVEDLAAELGAG